MKQKIIANNRADSDYNYRRCYVMFIPVFVL